MKRLLTIVVVLALFAGALFAGTTFWFGLQAERQYRDLLGQTWDLRYVRLADGGYERGFFKSKARTEVSIQAPSRARQAGGAGQEEDLVRFTLVHNIDHGPWPLWRSPDAKFTLKPVQAVMETSIELNADTRARLEKALGEVPELAGTKLWTTLLLAGNGKTQLVVPAFHRKAGQAGKVLVDWQGLDAEMTFTSDLKGFVGSLTAPGLRIEANEDHLRVKGVACSFDIHEGIQGLYLGNASWGVDDVEFSARGQGEEKPFSATGINLKTSSKASNGAVDYAMALAVNQLTTQNTPYGPGICQLELRNLDAQTLKRLGRTMEEVQAEVSQRSPEEISRMMVARYAQILPGFLKSSPEIEMTRLSFKTKDGELTGKAKVVVDGAKASALGNPLLLLSALRAHAEFTVTDRLLEQILESTYENEITADQEADGGGGSEQAIKALAAAKAGERLNNLSARKMLLHEGHIYKASAAYQQGTLTVNNRPVTLQDFME